MKEEEDDEREEEEEKRDLYFWSNLIIDSNWMKNIFFFFLCWSYFIDEINSNGGCELFECHNVALIIIKRYFRVTVRFKWLN